MLFVHTLILKVANNTKTPPAYVTFIRWPLMYISLYRWSYETPKLPLWEPQPHVPGFGSQIVRNERNSDLGSLYACSSDLTCMNDGLAPRSLLAWLCERATYY